MTVRATLLAALFTAACATTRPAVVVEQKEEKEKEEAPIRVEPSDVEKLKQIDQYVRACELEPARRLLNRVRYGGEELREIVEALQQLEVAVPAEQPARARAWWAKAQPGPTALAATCARKEIDRALEKVPNSPLYLLLSAVDDLRDFTEHPDATERIERARAVLERLPSTFELDTGVSVAVLRRNVEKIRGADERWNDQITSSAALKHALAKGELSATDFQDEARLSEEAQLAAEREWTEAVAPFRQYAAGPPERVEPPKKVARHKKLAKRHSRALAMATH